MDSVTPPGVPEGIKNWWCYYGPVINFPRIGGAIKSVPILKWQKIGGAIAPPVPAPLIKVPLLIFVPYRTSTLTSGLSGKSNIWQIINC